MNRRKILMIMGVTLGVFLGMRYLLPVLLPFLCGWLLAELFIQPPPVWQRAEWERLCM